MVSYHSNSDAPLRKGQKGLTTGSSASEFSENEEFVNQGSKKFEAVEIKIRTYCCQFVQNTIKVYQNILQNNWQHLIKSNNLTKELQGIILKDIQQSKPQILQLQKDDKNKQKLKNKYFSQLKANFMEPSLLGLLMFEDNEKCRQNILKILTIFIENLMAKQFLIGLEIDSIEKFVGQKFQPKSVSLYLIFKNIHQVLLISLNNEENIQICNQILKVVQTLIQNSIILEKIPYDQGLKLWISEFFVPFLQNYQQQRQQQQQHKTISITEKNTYNYLISDKQNLVLNSLNCLNSILNMNVKFDQFQQEYLNFNNLQQQEGQQQQSLYELILSYLVKPNDKENDTFTIIMRLEAIGFLIKSLKNYKFSIQNQPEIWEIFKNDFLQIYENITQDPKDKVLILAYKFVEESVKACQQENNENKDNQDEDYQENYENNDLNKKSQQQINYEKNLFYEFLPEFLMKCLQSKKSTEINMLGLNILSSLDNQIMESQIYQELYSKIIEKLKDIMNIISMTSLFKCNLYKCMGTLSFRQQFFEQNSELFEKFLQYIFDNGSQEKNVNIQVKICWALVSISSNFKVIPKKYIEDILKLLLVYCKSNKDKIHSNALRGFGTFLNNLLNLEENFGISKEKLEIYVKDFQQQIILALDSKQAKVVWNSCVTIKLLLESQHQLVIQYFYKNQQVLDKLFHILEESSNFKSQILCLQTLISFKNKEDYGNLFTQYILSSQKFLGDMQDKQYTFAEIKYLESLKQHAMQLFLKLCLYLENNIEKENSLMWEIFEKNASQTLDNISKFLIILGKKNSKEIFLTNEEKAMIIKEAGQLEGQEIQEKIFNLEQKKLSELSKEQNEELILKGGDKQIYIQFDFEEENVNEQKLQCLQQISLVKQFSDKLCKFIDNQEEAQLSFGIFDMFKEYSQVDIQSNKFKMKVQLQ